MFASSFYLTFLAFVVALVSAQTSISATSTSTISMTQTITLTRCNPTVTNCPANKHNTTTVTTTPTTIPIPLSTYYPASNTSTIAWPTTYAIKNKTTPHHIASTGGFTKSTVAVLPSSSPVAATSPAAATPVAPAATSSSAAPATPSSISTSGAQTLFVQSGLLLAALAGAVALLA